MYIRFKHSHRLFTLFLFHFPFRALSSDKRIVKRVQISICVRINYTILCKSQWDITVLSFKFDTQFIPAQWWKRLSHETDVNQLNVLRESQTNHLSNKLNTQKNSFGNTHLTYRHFIPSNWFFLMMTSNVMLRSFSRTNKSNVELSSSFSRIRNWELEIKSKHD